MNTYLILSYFKKVRLMQSQGWYKTMSGDWRDSHGVRYISKYDFLKMNLDELRKAVSNG